MQTKKELYSGDDLKFSQDEKNLIVWAVRVETRTAISQISQDILPDVHERAEALKAILEKMDSAGWGYPSDYSGENYQ